jgi:two-component system chemotaxis response regulator CheY
MSINILIVDDSAVMREMIIKIMRMSGLPLGDLFEAANGQEGLQALDKHWIDLAILDINMPVMTGEEMINCMHENPATKDIPVLVVSTEGSETRIERFRSLGARFIQKPFSPETIRDTVKDMTGIGDYDE